MKAIYPLEREFNPVIDGKDNTGVQHMIALFKKWHIIKPIFEGPNGKFDPVNYQGFEFSDAMLEKYCEMYGLSFWGNVLEMMRIAEESENGVSCIFDVNLAIEFNPEMLDAYMPQSLPFSTIEIEGEALPQTWRNWRKQWNENEPFFSKNDKAYMLTITDKKLNQKQILALKSYKDENPDFEINFLTYKQYSAI